MRPVCFLLVVCLTTACDDVSNKPLDAKTRQAIDSIATEHIRLAKIELDSQCAKERFTELPRLVDSIRAVREKQIQEKLKGVVR